MYTIYSGDNRPLTHWGGRPVYATTLLLAGCILALVLAILADIIPLPLLRPSMEFWPSMTWESFQLWRPFTYWLITQVNFFSVFFVCFIYFWGKGVEEALGLRRTIVFYFLTILAPVLFVTLLWLCGIPGGLEGPILISMATIIAFATLYPGMTWYGSISMKWLAWICIALACVNPLQHRDYVGLLSLFFICGMAFGYVRWIQHGAPFPNIRWPFQKKPKFRVVRDEPREREETALASVDQILDKIAKHGLKSLTRKEKAILEKGRSELLDRDEK